MTRAVGYVLACALAAAGLGCGGDGECRSAIVLTAVDPTCNTLTNSARLISFGAASGAPLAPRGGAIADGLYQATRDVVYGQQPPSGQLRASIAVLDGGTRMLWAEESPGLFKFRANATIAVSGSEIAVTTTCNSSRSAALLPVLKFTSTDGELVLFSSFGSISEVTTYAHRGCP